jgi:hypothetical protein
MLKRKTIDLNAIILSRSSKHRTGKKGRKIGAANKRSSKCMVNAGKTSE